MNKFIVFIRSFCQGDILLAPIVNLVLVTCILLFAVSRLYGPVWLNIGNLALVHETDKLSEVSVFGIFWSELEWVQERLQINAETIAIMTSLQQDANQSDMTGELYAALNLLQPQNLSFPELCDSIKKNPNSLEAYTLPAFARLAQHGEDADWTLHGISFDYTSNLSANSAVLVLWWKKLVLEDDLAVPLIDKALSAPCVSEGIVGVPIAGSILNRDPRFTRSSQIQNSYFAKRYIDYFGSPFLIDFSPLDLARSLPVQSVSLPRYMLHSDSPDLVTLEFLSGGLLTSPMYTVYPDDSLMLVTRFKTTGTSKGAVPFWWGEINVGSYTAGYSPDTWSTHVLLFDMPRCCTDKGQVLVSIEGEGTVLLDIVALLRLGRN